MQGSVQLHEIAVLKQLKIIHVLYINMLCILFGLYDN